MPSNTNDGERFMLIDLAIIIWRQKRFIALFVFASVAISIVYSLVVTPQYRSEALLRSPTPLSSGETGFGSLGGQLGSLASIANLAGSEPDVNEAVALMESRTFTEDLLLEDGVVRHIYEDFWDAEASKWRDREPGVLGNIKYWLKAAYNALLPASKPAASNGRKNYTGPSLEEAVVEFNSLRKISVDRKTGYVKISIEWKDPVVARDWVALIVSRLNETARARAKAEAEVALGFLQERISQEQNASLRLAMSALFQQQLRNAMLSEVREEHSLQYIDTPFVPEQRTSPRRKTIVIGTFVLSLILAIAGLFLKHAVARDISEFRARSSQTRG